MTTDPVVTPARPSGESARSETTNPGSPSIRPALNTPPLGGSSQVALVQSPSSPDLPHRSADSIQSGAAGHEQRAQALHAAKAELLSRLETAQGLPEEVPQVLARLIDAAPPEHAQAFVEALSQQEPAQLGQRLADLVGADPVAASRAAMALIRSDELGTALQLGSGLPDASRVFVEVVRTLPDRVPDGLAQDPAGMAHGLARDAVSLLAAHSPLHAFWLEAAPSLAPMIRDADGPLRRAVSTVPEQERPEMALAALAWWSSSGLIVDQMLGVLRGEDAGQAWNVAANWGMYFANPALHQQFPGGAPAIAGFERAAQAVVAAVVPSTSAQAEPLRGALAREAAHLVRHYAPANAAVRDQERAKATRGTGLLGCCPGLERAVRAALPQASTAWTALTHALSASSGKPSVPLRRLIEAFPPARRPAAALMLAFGTPLMAGQLHALTGADEVGPARRSTVSSTTTFCSMALCSRAPTCPRTGPNACKRLRLPNRPSMRKSSNAQRGIPVLRWPPRRAI